MEYSTFMIGLFNAPTIGDCYDCGGTGYKAIGCCSGYDCGCQGKPIDFVECDCEYPQATDEQIIQWAKEAQIIPPSTQ